MTLPFPSFSLGSAGNDNYLQGKLLVATHELDGTCFERAVIYVCSHTKDGAMGLVINQILPHLSCYDILEQLKLDTKLIKADVPIWFGGPVDTGKGFVLHSPEYFKEETIELDDTCSMTSSIRILKDIVLDHGPEHALMMLGYAGWGAGQLDNEIKRHSWFIAESTPELLFHTNPEHKWELALQGLGVQDMAAHHFVQVAGNA